MHSGSGVIAQPILILPLHGCQWPASRLCRFISGKRAPATQMMRGWMGFRAGLDDKGERKFSCIYGN
jgi:hypothetical protein